MPRIYAISKVTNLYSDHMVTSLLNHYFENREEAQKFLSKFADEEFGDGSFYKTISDNGEIDRRWSDYTEGIYLTFGGRQCCIEYGIITLRSYSDYLEKKELA